MTTDKAGAHTQGRLNYRYNGREVSQGGVRYCDIIIPSPMGYPHTTIVSMIPEPDARRLAACWNFCEGVDTDVLETHADLRQRIDAYASSLAEMAVERDRAVRELAAALALLAESLTTEDDIGVAERIVAFLKGKK